MKHYTLSEDISLTTTIEHLQERLNKVATLLVTIADKPILYRAFSYKENYNSLLIKVIDNRADYLARSGSNPKQPELLKAIGVKKPVFCTMVTPTGGWSAFGTDNIVIPPASYRIIWSPVVEDMGGNKIIGPNASKYGHEEIGKNMYKSPTGDRLVGAEFANTYVEGWPASFTKNEIILECDKYYLINLKKFISEFATKTDQFQDSRTKAFNQQMFNAKFTNYGDLANYLTSMMPKYLEQISRIYKMWNSK